MHFLPNHNRTAKKLGPFKKVLEQGEKKAVKQNAFGFQGSVAESGDQLNSGDATKCCPNN